MSFFSARHLRGLMLLAGVVSAPSHADWTVGDSLAVVRPAPEGDLVQGQNPPGFAWSQKLINRKPATGYEVEVTDASGGIQRFEVSRNWLLPEAAFAPGSYTWRVRPKEGGDWSDLRKFRIDALASMTFEVPNEAALKKAIRARGDVRSLPADLLAHPTRTPPERLPLRVRLQSEVDRNKNLPAPADANWPERYANPMTQAYRDQTGAVRSAINSLGKQLEAAALLWRLRGADSAAVADANKKEAIRRGNELAALDVDGPTSFVNQDQATRLIAMALVKAVDLLGKDLDEGNRATWLNVIEKRTAVIYDNISGHDGRLDQRPFDSHGGTNYGVLATIATLGLDRVPSAETWFNYAFRGYVNGLSPWGGTDGGFANGTAYAEYSEDYYAQMWQPLAAASGVNLFAKPWAVGLAQFMAHFEPAGSPTHVFGDEHEVVPVKYLSKSFAMRVPSPAAAWYAKSLPVDENALPGLQAPLSLGASIVPAPPANAAQYPSVGWVAMHRDITDPKTTSIYFKSSPYGSFNHGHADQNSIVVNSGGRQLLIEAGKSDGYGTEQARDWYRQTRAHNAITSNGGIGQRLGLNDDPRSLGWNGRISGFSTSQRIDTVTGTATAAYDAPITSAVRQLWYLRDKNVLVVRDTLSATEPRTFEWNMHALSVMDMATDGTVKIVNDGRELCIRSMTGDTGFFNFDATANAVRTPQVHGAFHNKAPGKTAEFIVVLDIGCSRPTLELSGTRTDRVLWIDRQEVPLH